MFVSLQNEMSYGRLGLCEYRGSVEQKVDLLKVKEKLPDHIPEELEDLVEYFNTELFRAINFRIRMFFNKLAVLIAHCNFE